MNTDKIEEGIPEQETGAQSDNAHSITVNDVAEAKHIFVRSRQRLLQVNAWHQLAGAASAVFHLTDQDGNEVDRDARTGDYFKIDLPAPKEGTGKGYDWVVVEDIIDKSDPDGPSEGFVIRVRPASNPTQPGNVTAHFFDETATSSFAVQREGRKITVSVHGRNEVANTSTESLLDKARNTLVAIGAMIGLSTPQWKSLVKGILEK